MLSLASLGTIIACVFLLGTFLSVALNVRSTLQQMEQSVGISVFFEPGISTERKDQIGEEIKKKEDKNKPKGAPIGPQMQEGATPADSNSFKVTYEDYPTVMIPVTLITADHKEIPPGYYRILSAKKENGYFLNFYQGSSLVAKISAIETGDDHNQKSLNYAKVIPVNDSFMNVIYGDIDCNIEAVVRIKH